MISRCEAPDLLLGGDDRAFGDREDDADRIELVHRRQRRRARRDEVALGERDRADPPVDRRGDGAIAEIEPGLSQARLGGEHRGLVLLVGCGRLVEAGLRLEALGVQPHGPLIGEPGLDERRLRRGELSLGRLHRGFVLRVLELKEVLGPP